MIQSQSTTQRFISTWRLRHSNQSHTFRETLFNFRKEKREFCSKFKLFEGAEWAPVFVLEDNKYIAKNVGSVSVCPIYRHRQRIYVSTLKNKLHEFGWFPVSAYVCYCHKNEPLKINKSQDYCTMESCNAKSHTLMWFLYEEAGNQTNAQDLFFSVCDNIECCIGYNS